MKGFNKYKALRSKELSNFIIINYYYDYYYKVLDMLFYLRIGSASLSISGEICARYIILHMK